EAENVSRGIAEPRGDLGRIHADGLYELPALKPDRVEARGDAVDHDVDQHTGLSGGRPAGDPDAADLAGSVVEGNVTVSSPAGLPAENSLIERDGASDV